MQERIEKKAKKFAFQLEKGVQTGYRHYQGRMSLRKRIREGPSMTELGKFLGGDDGESHGWYCRPPEGRGKSKFTYELQEDTREAGPWTDNAPAENAWRRGTSRIECSSAGCGNTSDTATGVTWKRRAFTFFRCHTCNRMNARIARALRDLPEEAAQRWRTTSKEQKAEFRDRNKETRARDMPAALTTYVTESFQELESCAANAKGLFKDKADLTEKYSKNQTSSRRSSRTQRRCSSPRCRPRPRRRVAC